MKKIKSIISFLIITSVGLGIISCNDESAAGPGETDSFIKLFGSENEEAANDMFVSADGSIILLLTQEIENQDGDIFNKIKVLHLDDLGNTLWEARYPEVAVEEQTVSYKGSSIIESTNGYLIVGESINSDNQTSLLILEIDSNGGLSNNTEFSLDNGTTPIRGIDISFSNSNEIKVVGQIDRDTDNIWVGTFDATLNNLPDCSFTYAPALSNTSILKSSNVTVGGDIIFGLTGTQSSPNRTNSRFVRLPNCQPIPISAPFVDDNSSNAYIGSQITKTFTGYAFIGTTDTNGNDDIFMVRVSEQGEVQNEGILIFNTLADASPLAGDEAGLGITQTRDGGFLLSGASESNLSGGSDIILIKTDLIGNVQWTQFIGDQNDEEANVVAQAPDGGFLILGTTEFGGINTPILIKTDRSGNLN